MIGKTSGTASKIATAEITARDGLFAKTLADTGYATSPQAQTAGHIAHLLKCVCSPNPSL
jgi:hypothetical protein